MGGLAFMAAGSFLLWVRQRSGDTEIAREIRKIYERVSPGYVDGYLLFCGVTFLLGGAAAFVYGMLQH